MKTRLFIEQMLRKQETLLYLPVDISEEYLKEVAAALQNDYKDTLSVDPVAGEYLDGLKEIKNKCNDDTLILWFGGLISMSYKDQIKYLSNVGDAMKVNEKLLITIDTTHPSQKSKIEVAYLDPLGYCGHFVLNSIRRLNNELDGNIDISNFALKNKFVENNSLDSCSGIQLWMEALEECRYDIKELNLIIQFQKGEKLFFHEGDFISSKYSQEQIRYICQKANLRILDSWKNEHVTALLIERK